MTDPTKIQVGGSHYLDMAIDPRTFCMRNGWDCDAFSILKYLSRYRRKNGFADLQKAKHFADLREVYLSGGGDIPDPVSPFDATTINVADYVDANGIDRSDNLARAIIELDCMVNCWVQHPSRRTTHHNNLLGFISLLIKDLETEI